MFKRRTEAPKKDNPLYYSKENKYFRDGYGMPNCTAYALGRYKEVCNEWLQYLGNAEDWYDAAVKTGKYQCASEPRLGAVACWKCGKVKNGSDGAGHVAIVEEIKPNGDIVTSNSASKRTEWYEATYSRSKGYNWKSSITGKQYDFQGFIYPVGYLCAVPQLKITKSIAPLKNGAGDSFTTIATLKKHAKIYTDGVQLIADDRLWLHGKSDGYTGWVSTKYIK